MTRPAPRTRAAICTARCPTPPAPHIDGVAGLHSAVKAREGGEEAHRQRCRIQETQGFRFGDGQELPRKRIAPFAATPGDPAAVAIQISHRHHRVANGYAAHGVACGHDDAGQVEPEDDRGRPPKEVKVGELVLQRVERRGGDADQNLVGPRPRDRNTHRLQWKPGPVFGVADTEERLWDRKCLLTHRLTFSDNSDFLEGSRIAN